VLIEARDALMLDFPTKKIKQKQTDHDHLVFRDWEFETSSQVE